MRLAEGQIVRTVDEILYGGSRDYTTPSTMPFGKRHLPTTPGKKTRAG